MKLLLITAAAALSPAPHRVNPTWLSRRASIGTLTVAAVGARAAPATAASAIAGTWALTQRFDAGSDAAPSLAGELDLMKTGDAVLRVAATADDGGGAAAARDVASGAGISWKILPTEKKGAPRVVRFALEYTGGGASGATDYLFYYQGTVDDASGTMAGSIFEVSAGAERRRVGSFEAAQRTAIAPKAQKVPPEVGEAIRALNFVS